VSIEAVFYTQIGSIIAFLATLFVLYRLLITSKDATIETLKQQISFLETKVKALTEAAPDVLLQRHEKRAFLFEKELEAAEKEKEPLLTEIEELRRKLATRDSKVQERVLINQVVAGRVDLENRLRQALQREEFVLYYQPKIEFQSKKVIGAEALLRWNDPHTGIVLPPAFIPILEESGLIYEISRWAMHRALEDYLRWCAAGLTAVRIGLNVSSLQMRNPAFVSDIEGSLNIDNRAPSALELEITESLLVQDFSLTVANLTAVRAMGVTVAIDDFGTGYSSLSYLSRLPLDRLKIDQSFVADMNDPDNRAIVSAIISLAHSLNLKVLAEGVETDQQSRLLQIMECDEMQGDLISKPLQVDIFEKRYLTTVK